MNKTTVARPTFTPGPAHDYSAEIIEVTPRLAELWLQRNTRNRNPNDALATLYARDMDAGHWPFTGEAVKFSFDGDLLDGQHRLAAVVRHGRPVLMLVVRGLDPASQDVMDTGRKRTAADMFGMHGVKNAAVTAAVARLAVAWQLGRITHSNTQYYGNISNAMIWEFSQDDPLLDWATALSVAVKKDLPAKPAAIGFAAWMMGYADQAEADDFIRACAQMRTNGVGDPRFTLLKRLSTAKTGGERLTAVQESFYILTAWNAVRRGAALKAIKATTSAGPRPFPDAL